MTSVLRVKTLLRARSAAVVAAVSLVATAFAVVGPVAPAAHADVAGKGGDYIALGVQGHLLDTRSAIGVTTTTPIGAGVPVSFQVLGRGGVPSSGVSGIVVDITTSLSTAASALQLAPDGSTSWPISNLNFPANGSALSNTAIVQVGANGKVAVLNTSGSTHVIIDVQGYYTSATASTGPGGFIPTAHTRVADTRSGIGVPQATIPAGGSLTVNMTAGGAIPPGAVSAMFDVIVAASGSGWLAQYPAGGSAASATSLFDFPSGTNASGATAKLGSNNSVVFVNHSAAAINLIITAEGYTSSSSTQGAGYRPARYRDASAVVVAASATVDVQVLGRNGVPTRGVAAVAANLTATSQTGSGYLRGWPTDGVEPATSLANFTTGIAQGDLAFLKPGADGKIRVRNLSSGTIRLFVDVEAWYYDGISTAVEIAQNSATSITQPVAGGAVEGAYVRNGGGLFHGYAASPDSLDQAQWSPVDSNLEAFSGQPSLIRLPSGKLLVAVLHAGDGEVWTFETVSGASWPTPAFVRTGGIMAAPPTSGALSDGSVLTFGVDADGRLWVLSATAGSYWQSLGDADLAGTPTVVTISDGVQLVGRTTAGTVVTAAYRNSALGAWTDLGGIGVTDKVAAVVNQGPRVRIVARQSDGSVISKLQSITGTFPTSWTTVGTPGATFTGAPAVGIDLGSGTDPGSGKAFILIRNSVDHYLYQADETGEATGVWGDWYLVPGQSNPAGTDATVSSFSGSANNFHWIACYLDSFSVPKIIHAPVV